MIEKKGKILKSLGGFFYVKTIDGLVYECKARGVFRNKELKPVAGDNVNITVEENKINVIQEILPRKNLLVRPPIANIDQMFIVSSIKEPNLNTFIIDKLTVIALLLKIVPIVLISKTDLENSNYVIECYKKSGLKVMGVSNKDNKNISQILKLIQNKTSAFIGNSGVGKSTLLNILFPEFDLNTGEISKKLGRGKHTTRQVELFPICRGYVADTPGFSSLDLLKCVQVSTETLQEGFLEFHDYLGTCKFNSCSHTCEEGCKIIDAVRNGKISKQRYESYVAMYRDIKN